MASWVAHPTWSGHAGHLARTGQARALARGLTFSQMQRSHQQASLHRVPPRHGGVGNAGHLAQTWAPTFAAQL
eukprot:2040590-Alexandrium_andersonii.AAC.1